MVDLASALFSRAIFDLGVDWLARTTVWFSATTLLVMMLRPLLRKLNAAVAYFSWLLLPVSVLLSALLHQLPQVAALNLPAGARTLATGMQAAVAAMPLESSAAPWLFSVWLLGALLFGLMLILQHRRYAKGLTLDGTVSGTQLRAPDARGPALLGLWQPKIVLPCNFEQRFSAPEQALIRAHEAIHLARSDNAWNALAASLLCLQWFNPIAHVAWRRMRVDQESSCDAAVLRTRPESLAAYARALFKAQEEDLPNRLACQWQSTHPLIERIKMLKNHTPSSSATFAGRAIFVLAACVAVGAAFATQALGSASDESAPFYKLALQIQLDGKDWQKPTLVVRAGVRAKVSMTGDGESWDIEVLTHPLPDNKLDLKTVISRGMPWQVIARPRLIAQEGENAGIQLTTVDGAHTLLMNVVGTLVNKADMDAIMAPSQR